MKNEVYDLISSIFEEALGEKTKNENGMEILQTGYKEDNSYENINYQLKADLPILKPLLANCKNYLTMPQVIDKILLNNGLVLSDVVKRINYRFARQTIYRIASHTNPFSAKKEILVCIAFCSNATAEQLYELLASEGYILADNSQDDTLVKYCFANKKSIEFYEAAKECLLEESVRY